MKAIRAVLIALSLLPPIASLCQTASGTIPAGTPLALKIDEQYPMRPGQPVRAHLLYPIYTDSKLLLAKDTIVTGSVVNLLPDHARRTRAMLGGDFTPFHIPEVQFTQIVLADGVTIPLTSGTASTGTQIYRAVAPPSAKGGFLHRQFDAGVSAARTDVATFTTPGKVNRLLQFVYGRLPYHPQRIEKGMSWTVETTTAIDLPAQPAPLPLPPPSAHKLHFWDERSPAPQPPANDKGSWIVQANLTDSLSSETSTNGQAIKAIVAEPIYNPDHTIAVPQGATLVGVVIRAKPARRFGRSGVLSFSFSQLILPNAETQSVETRLTGADSAQNIALNSEGQAKSKPQDKIMVPLFLALMAARPLDSEHHDGGTGDQFAKNGVGGAAGLGLVGTIVGIAGGSPYAAAGIGYYGAARAFYDRWIARGQKIAFAKDTRIVVETTPRHSAPMTPVAQPAR